MAEQDLESAYVLHVRQYRESSGLVDFLCENEGRITLLAKGYRRNKKSGQASLQPFRKLLIKWSGRGELKTLSTFEESGAATLLEDQALISGFYLNELMTRLLQPGDPHPELFDLYHKAIGLLAKTQHIESVLRVFELNLLESLGYGLQLSCDVEGNDILDDSIYTYITEQGPVHSDLPGKGVKVSGSTLLQMNERNLFDAQHLKEAKKLMRYILSCYIGNKPLKSRELFELY